RVGQGKRQMLPALHQRREFRIVRVDIGNVALPAGVVPIERGWFGAPLSLEFVCSRVMSRVGRRPAEIEDRVTILASPLDSVPEEKGIGSELIVFHQRRRPGNLYFVFVAYRHSTGCGLATVQGEKYATAFTECASNGREQTLRIDRSTEIAHVVGE